MLSLQLHAPGYDFEQYAAAMVLLKFSGFEKQKQYCTQCSHQKNSFHSDEIHHHVNSFRITFKVTNEK